MYQFEQVEDSSIYCQMEGQSVENSSIVSEEGGEKDDEQVKIGLLQASWYSSNQQLTHINYGTAFLVTHNILMTCSHNIYNHSNRTYATSCLFIPSHQGRITSDVKKYPAVKGKYYHCLQVKDSVQFGSEPMPEQLCLIELAESVPSESYWSIGLVDAKYRSQLSLVGYPSAEYDSETELSRVIMRHKSLQGQLFDVQCNAISHKMVTQQGLSGSPIIYKMRSGRQVVIGVHTHRWTKSINKGLFFSEQMGTLLRKLEKQISDTESISVIRESDQEKETLKWWSGIVPSIQEYKRRQLADEQIDKVEWDSRTHSRLALSSSEFNTTYVDFFEHRRRIL